MKVPKVERSRGFHNRPLLYFYYTHDGITKGKLTFIIRAEGNYDINLQWLIVNDKRKQRKQKGLMQETLIIQCV